MASQYFTLSTYGESGSKGVTVTATNPNTTGKDRKATATISNGVKSKTVNIIQYFRPLIKTTIPERFDADGGTLGLTIDSEYELFFTGIPSWVELRYNGTLLKNNDTVPAGIGRTVNMKVLKNTTISARTAQNFFMKWKKNGTAFQDQLPITFIQNEGEIPTVYHSITYNFTNAYALNKETSVEDGQPFSKTIYSDNGYMFKASDIIKVTMGGVDITSTALVGRFDEYARVDVHSVTGDIVVTATASPKILPKTITMRYNTSAFVHFGNYETFTYAQPILSIDSMTYRTGGSDIYMYNYLYDYFVSPRGGNDMEIGNAGAASMDREVTYTNNFTIDAQCGYDVSVVPDSGRNYSVNVEASYLLFETPYGTQMVHFDEGQGGNLTFEGKSILTESFIGGETVTITLHIYLK